MIKATFAHEDEVIVLKVEGHAGQAEKGRDLVCASASILAYTVAQYVEYVDKAGGIKAEPRIEIEDGHMLIVANPTEEYLAEVLNAFFVAEVGFNLLAQNYPQYVELKLFNERE